MAVLKAIQKISLADGEKKGTKNLRQKMCNKKRTNRKSASNKRLCMVLAIPRVYNVHKHK